MKPSILPDGCLPPYWPRPPYPPVPEPEPDSLDEPVNWMTYSHPELYNMVHSGLDLTGAMAMSARWGRLGTELEEIANELARLLDATAAAWEGEAAELATGSVSALSEWSRNTGSGATEVASCISIQVDNATNARNNMPAPPYPINQPADPPASSVDAFTSGDFGTARSVVADPMIYTDQEHALHQQAARTMGQFQAESRDVYSTIPQFAPPDLRAMPYGDPVIDPGVPTPPPTTPQDHTSGTGTPGGSGGGSGSGGGYGGGAPVPPGERVTAGPGGLAGGGAIGAGPGEPDAQRPAAAAAAAGGRPGGPVPAGGMPMGAPGGARDDDETEHKTPSYLKEDDDIWGLNEKRVMPPVIGEAGHRA